MRWVTGQTYIDRSMMTERVVLDDDGISIIHGDVIKGPAMTPDNAEELARALEKAARYARDKANG